MTQTRTRFAPSPTGLLHVGAARTALFAWLLAHQNNGQFILRIEDTDKSREVENAEKHIQASLKWLGLDWDESVDGGGEYGPYRQSQRLEIYKKWAMKLVEKGRAYADPYSPEELQKFREQAKAQKQPFLFRNHRPNNPPEWDGNQPLRFKSEPKKYSWQDAVMGQLESSEEAIDDFILIKSDGFPTYNFAHIIDDMLMKISHVIRSQEFVSSVPKFLNLYEALEITPPVLATLPYVMAINGKKKLSKRDGAKDMLDYAREGYVPEAMMNFLATLGWNDGTEQEVFSVQELIEKFSLKRVQKSPSQFDEKRLVWLNGQWIRKLEIDDIYQRIQSNPTMFADDTKSEQSDSSFWPKSAKNANENYKKQVLRIVQDRLKTLEDLRQVSYFFTEPEKNMDLIETNKQLKKISPERRQELIELAKKALEKSQFNPEAIQETLNKLLETTCEKPGILFSLIRIYTTWAPFSPQLNETLALLGRDTVLKRLG